MPKATISSVHAREILDSRGIPTIEAEVMLSNKITARASVPSGTSTGKHEALELRDNEARFFGNGVLKAVKNVNNLISKNLIGKDATKQQFVDELMMKLDGTENKSRLGANAILAVSLAVCRAGALSQNKSLYQYIADLASNSRINLPVPYSNLINGGKHAGSALKFQEFMAVPYKAKKYSQAVQQVCEVYGVLKNRLLTAYGKNSINVGFEGGFAPPINTAEQALDLLEGAIEQAGYSSSVAIALDVGASEFYHDGKYVLDKDYSSGELTDYYLKLINSYPIISIEDPFEEEDFDSFAELNKKIGKKVQIVGDDLLVTNIKRIKTGVQKKSCNCALLKINQIGTLTETIAAHDLAVKSGWRTMVSHRSGETEDSFIADLAVGLGCGQIKLGAPSRGERTAKFNQLLRIEEGLGKRAKYGI